MGDDFRELFDSLETKPNTSFYDGKIFALIQPNRWLPLLMKVEQEAQIESLISESAEYLLAVVLNKAVICPSLSKRWSAGVKI